MLVGPKVGVTVLANQQKFFVTPWNTQTLISLFFFFLGLKSQQLERIKNRFHWVLEIIPEEVSNCKGHKLLHVTVGVDINDAFSGGSSVNRE